MSANTPAVRLAEVRLIAAQAELEEARKHLQQVLNPPKPKKLAWPDLPASPREGDSLYWYHGGSQCAVYSGGLWVASVKGYPYFDESRDLVNVLTWPELRKVIPTANRALDPILYYQGNQKHEIRPVEVDG